MTTESSTYTYEGGEQETVTLTRGRATPPGHAVLRIKHDDGKALDCYVNTAWLRDRANDLEPRALTPDAITDEMVERAWDVYIHAEGTTLDAWRAGLTAALTEPPARPEGAEGIERLLFDAGVDENRAEVADYLAARLTDPTRKEA